MAADDFAYSFCGSPEYMAPEMLMKTGHNYLVDCYCLGALLYELVTGLPPFYSENTNLMYRKILYGELVIPNNFSPQAKSLCAAVSLKIIVTILFLPANLIISNPHPNNPAS